MGLRPNASMLGSSLASKNFLGLEPAILSIGVKMVASGIKRKMKEPLTMSPPAMYRPEEEAWISN